MRVRCLTTGRVRTKAGERGLRRYLLADWRDETLPVHAFLVEHSSGLCLFDTGQTADATRPGYFPWWQPFFRLARFELGPEDEIVSQLRRCGIDPAALRWVVLSHLHTDHVGGLASLPSIEVLVPQVEWERAAGLRGRVRGYLPQYWPGQLEPRTITFAGPAVGPFVASHDVAGDGRLLLVPTPGHTPGHAALLVLDADRSWLLAGDLAHSGAELARVAPAIAEYCRKERIVVLTTHDAAAPALVEQ